MTEPGGDGGGSGWTFFKVFGVIVGLLGMVGFGICSLCGFAIAGHDSGVIVLALIGAGLAALFCWLVVAIVKSANRGRKREP